MPAQSSLRRLLFALIGLLVLGGVMLLSATPAQAIGVEIYRANQSGQHAGTIFKVGGTGPSCCCVNHGNSTLGLGVKVCYLPIP